MSNRKKSEGADQAREKIILTAVRMMAENGVDGVSMNEICKGAGQRNASALNYHFGDKSGLVQAIFEKFTQPVNTRRQQFLDKIKLDGGSVRLLVKAIVMPMVAELDNPEGGRDYLIFTAAVHNHKFEPKEITSGYFANAPLISIYKMLQKASGLKLPIACTEWRANFIKNILIHSMSDYCKKIQGSPSYDKKNREVFVNTLIDAITGVIESALSAETKKVLRH